MTHSNMTLLPLSELENRYPSGVYSADHGCFYFLDYDNELGYFIQYTNGNFESETQYVDLDTLADDEREECEAVALAIALKS